MRIGILGGTFNPIHIGHLILAEEAVWRLWLDKLIFVPTYIPPHKKIKKDVGAGDRYRMTCLAARHNRKFEVSRVEIENKQKSYSIDTLRYFRKRYGLNAKIFFIAGSDCLKDLSSWKDIKQVLRLAKFIIARRPGYPFRKISEHVKLMSLTGIAVSSSELRRRLKQGRSVRYLVPEAVWEYIVKKKLYMKT